MNVQGLADLDLLYAATERCRKCSAGLAYAIDREKRDELGSLRSAWLCSAVLKGEVEDGGHDSLLWSLYKVREETSINNRTGATTRPSGTIARTVGRAECPKCRKSWESEPYSACGLSHHWQSGPCPNCWYAVAAEGSWSTAEGEPIRHTFEDVILPMGA